MEWLKITAEAYAPLKLEETTWVFRKENLILMHEDDEGTILLVDVGPGGPQKLFVPKGGMQLPLEWAGTATPIAHIRQEHFAQHAEYCRLRDLEKKAETEKRLLEQKAAGPRLLTPPEKELILPPGVRE